MWKIFASIYILTFTISGQAYAYRLAPKKSTLHLITEENPPYQSVDSSTKKISGTSIDVVEALFKRADIKYDIRVFPWARAYDMALNTKNHGVFGTIKTAERTPMFEWVGPVSKSRWVLLARSDSNIKISTFEDAKKYKIGGYYGDAKTKFLEDKGLTIETVSNNELNVKKLTNGRIDLWVAGNISGRTIAAKQNIYNLREVFAFQEIEGFIAFNKDSDKTALAKLRETIKVMNDNNEIDSLIEKRLSITMP